MTFTSTFEPTQRLMLFLMLRHSLEGARRAIPVPEAKEALELDDESMLKAIAELESGGWVEVLPSSDESPLRVRLVRATGA